MGSILKYYEIAKAIFNIAKAIFKVIEQSRTKKEIENALKQKDRKKAASDIADILD